MWTARAICLTILMIVITMTQVAGEGDGAFHEERAFSGKTGESVSTHNLDIGLGAVKVTISLNWTTNLAQAFTLSVKDGDGNVKGTVELRSLTGEELIEITDISGHGIWALKITKMFCGCPDGTEVTYSITVDVLYKNMPLLKVLDRKGTIVSSAGPGDVLTFERQGSTQGSEFLVDFGDGEDSGWTPGTQVVHRYTEAGSYQVKARAKYEDGLVSGWRRSTILISEDDEDRKDGALVGMFELLAVAVGAFAAVGTARSLSGKR